MKPGVELLENAFEGHLAAGGSRRVIDEQHLNLHGCFRAFNTQHQIVGPAQLLHACLPPLSPPTLWCTASRKWLVGWTGACALSGRVRSNPCPAPGISRYLTAERDTDRRRWTNA